MKADIGRVTFEPAKHFLRVVMQQGRVQLESDWNEQVAILIHDMRTLAADLIGPWGGSAHAFTLDIILNVKNNVSLGAGHYYVDGILCDNPPADELHSYLNQPFYATPDDQKLTGPQGGGENTYLLFLDVWERLVTAAEDEDLREVALGGPDTAARTQVVWQVKARQFDANVLSGLTCANMSAKWPPLRDQLAAPQRGRLRARARMPAAEIDRPCAIDPSAAYRFDENALFRVEVHTPGLAGTATFKWSLDNGAVAFPIESVNGSSVQLSTLGRDPRQSLEVGDWVELESDSSVLLGRAEALFQVQSVEYTDLTVMLDRAADVIPAAQHPRLRRWDQKGTARDPLDADGTTSIVEATSATDGWLSLIYGVQVQFVAPAPASPTANQYRTGDYWLIPARAAIGDVLWPQEQDAAGTAVPAARPPHGVEHHYAPLGWVAVAADGTVTINQQFQRVVRQLAECP